MSLSARLVLLTFATALSLAGPTAALAKAGKSTGHAAKWIAYDAATKTVKVQIRNGGEGPNKRMLKKNQEATFRVVPEGSILKRTTVAINGKKGELTDIGEGRTVVVYWVPDEENKGGFFARKIDVVMSQEEFESRYKVDD